MYILILMSIKTIVNILLKLSNNYHNLEHPFVYSKIYNNSHKKINNQFSDWAPVLIDIPQVSVLGSLLIAIYINDFFKLCF